MSVVLSDHLPLLASAPDGIQKLRGLILELAVRGKLVPQNPDDEPASELLKRIAKERARLEADGVCKRSKPLSPVGDDEQPFALPRNWAWVRLPEVYFSISPSSNKLLSSAIQETGAVPVVDQGKRYIAGYTDQVSMLINIPGPVVIFGDHTTERKYVDFDFVAGADGVKILRPILQYEKFFFRQLQGFKLEERGYARHFKVLNDQLYALPPLAEQHRIVAKVDELMALCDRLEAEQADAAGAHARLVETLLGTLTQSTDAADLAANWQRLAEHFDTLFTTEASIDALKQTVLQLAVMGKLVPQDASDEPAIEFLKRIADEKAHLESKGIGKKTKPVALIGEEGRPLTLRSGWQWTSFGQATICRDGERIPISQDERNLREKLYDYYGASGVIDKIDGFLFDKPLLLIGEDGANLINRSTPIAFIARGKYWVNNHAHVIDGITEAFLRFMELYINATDLKPYVTGTAQPKMNQAKMNGIPIAMPPEAEQHRIVAKVDELMDLCDSLKADLIVARRHQAMLADTLINSALEVA